VRFSSWGWSQEGINQYNKLFKATVLPEPKKLSWASDLEMDVVESLKGMTLPECIIGGNQTVKDKEKMQVGCSGW
jgi:hypothetical protein